MGCVVSLRVLRPGDERCHDCLTRPRKCPPACRAHLAKVDGDDASLTPEWCGVMGQVEKSPFLPSSLQARLEEKGEALVSRLGEGLRGIHAEARDTVMQR